jgi:1-acyl-sn-glycerol-3-phosphate acyltransferase
VFYWVGKGIITPLLRLVYRVRVRGLEHLPTSGGAVVAANHVSFLDSFFIPMVIPRRKLVYLAKAEYFESWRTAWFFRMMGQIPLERAGGKRSRAALDLALEILKRGDLLGIYPEGTRSPDGRLHRGRTGAARLACSAGVVVVPCGIRGTAEIMPRSARWPRMTGRPPVEVTFGPPVTLEDVDPSDPRALRAATDELMRAIQELSGQDYVDAYAVHNAA